MYSFKTCKLRLQAETKQQRLTIRFLFIDIFDSKDGCEDYLKITGETADSELIIRQAYKSFFEKLLNNL